MKIMTNMTTDSSCLPLAARICYTVIVPTGEIRWNGREGSASLFVVICVYAYDVRNNVGSIRIGISMREMRRFGARLSCRYSGSGILQPSTSADRKTTLFLFAVVVKQKGNESMATKRVVDLVFLVDVTGSMRPCIDGLKDSIDKFFAHLTDEENNSLAIKDWRAKVVGYRDVKFDKDKWLENNPFVTSSTEIHEQLQRLVAKGGGDEPESLLDALLVLADMGETGIQDEYDPMKWRSRSQAARAVVVFTDATYHSEAMLDEYEGANYEDVGRKIMEQRIILEIVTPVHPSDKKVSKEAFENCYTLGLGSINGAEYCRLVDSQDEEFSFDDIPAHPDLFTNFMEQLAHTISASAEVPEL